MLEPSVIIFLLSYTVLAIGGTPVLRIDRTGAVIIGASLMVFLGILSPEEAYGAIDYKTLATLFGLMVLVAHFRLSGAVNILCSRMLRLVTTPKGMLAVMIPVAGALSALFINDTICLMLTPVVLSLTYSMGTDPRPHLIALCMAANIGSVMTITGNPQNLIIGLSSGISYGRFFIKMLPPTIMGLTVTYLVIRLNYRDELSRWSPRGHQEGGFVYHRWMVIKFSILSLACIGGFFLGMPIEVVSMAVASAFLITRRVKPDKVYAMIDFKLLLLFLGLFIIMGAFQRSNAFALLESKAALMLGGSWRLVWSSTILSNLVSNVPAVMLFKPLIQGLGLGERAWLLLAMSSTFAGNLTILGSIANIIVVEGASSRVRISFLEHLRSGIPITLASISLGALWLIFF
ncbi:SLC13 family permease [Thermanaerovibrio acidaminovorans]|uniref:Citrate transporter n=1 Tax=Thermanaerovibrio acidaminovorans (strain ATCC 49978 / DSM 6589 / Su883) TaxID=525903 RepID=D1B9L6_THEAS|nr:anion transporter [Thermanaerovibrio acidaminovorans]ACZ18969.1 Citrate transporter [Thermanaerovibrio acidaminovorans DSM 6589]